LVKANEPAATVRRRTEVLAIFPAANRAKAIVDKLKQNGGDASVVPGPDPSDPTFNVVLSFPDTPDGYRAATKVIENADLGGLVTLPTAR
jgi:hypothetical protein